MIVAIQEPLADLMAVPAVGPVGLHGDDVETAELAHAIDYVGNHARKLVVIASLLRAIQHSEWGVIDVLRQDNLWLGAVLGNAGQGWYFTEPAPVKSIGIKQSVQQVSLCASISCIS